MGGLGLWHHDAEWSSLEPVSRCLSLNGAKVQLKRYACSCSTVAGCGRSSKVVENVSGDTRGLALSLACTCLTWLVRFSHASTADCCVLLRSAHPYPCLGQRCTRPQLETWPQLHLHHRAASPVARCDIAARIERLRGLSRTAVELSCYQRAGPLARRKTVCVSPFVIAKSPQWRSACGRQL